MELREIKRLVFGGENDQVEFKHKVNHPEKVIREVVAFANAGGGHLIIGVSDDKTITGLKYADEEDYILKKAIDELCRPAIDYESLIVPISEKKSLLYYRIYPGKTKPYYAFEKRHHRYGKAFVRVRDRSIQASPEIRRILKLSNKPRDTHFEYGYNEKMLFTFLNDHDKITLRQYRELTGLNYREASDTIVRMVSANVLKIIPREKEDWITSAE